MSYKRCHIQDSLVNQCDGQNIIVSNGSEHEMEPCLNNKELSTKAREIHEVLTSEKLYQTSDSTSLYDIKSHTLRSKGLTLMCKSLPTGLILYDVDFEAAQCDMPQTLPNYIKVYVVDRPKNPCWIWAENFYVVRRPVLRGILLSRWDSDQQGILEKTIRRSSVREVQTQNNRMKFGVKLPMTVKEAYALDKLQGNTRLEDSIKKELDSIMNRKTLHFPDNKLENVVMEEIIHGNAGFQFAPMWFMFDIKPISITQKAWLIIGGNPVDTEGTERFSNMFSTEGSRVLLVIADHKSYEMVVGDVSTAYLYATTKENVHSRATGEAWSRNGYITKYSNLCLLHKAQYVLPGSGYSWWL